MLVRINSKGQVRLPAHVMESLGVAPGDLLELEDAADGFVLRPRRLDPSLLAPLRDKVRADAGGFDVGAFRGEPYEPSLRD